MDFESKLARHPVGGEETPPAERAAEAVEAAELPESKEAGFTPEGIESLLGDLETAATNERERFTAELDAELAGHEQAFGLPSETNPVLEATGLQGKAEALHEESASLLSTFREKLSKIKDRLRSRAVAGALAGSVALGAQAGEGPEAPVIPDGGHSIPESEEIIPGGAPVPDIPKVFQMDETIDTTPGRSGAEQEADPMKVFMNRPGLFEGFGDVSFVANGDPVVLKLVREIEDPEGVFKEGEIVMEGYQGFTEKQLRSLQKLSEIAGREFTFVFSRDGNEKFDTDSREKDGKMSAVVDVESIMGSLQRNRETVQAHTHPAAHTNVFIPSLDDLSSDVYLRQLAEQRGMDSGKLRGMAIAPNGIWEYSVDPYNAYGKRLTEIAHFKQEVLDAANAEIDRMGMSPEEEQAFRSRFELTNLLDFYQNAKYASDPRTRTLSTAITKKVESIGGKLLHSSAGEVLKGYAENAQWFTFQGDTAEVREKFLRWCEQNGIRMTFTPFPEAFDEK